jgi:hypothetical protein
MQKQSDNQLLISLDKQDYNEADLVTIKVPLSLPYMNVQQSFDRIDGEINYKGKILKYVKRKIEDGYLILKCLPDQNKMEIESAKEEFFKYANDLVQNNYSKKPTSTKPKAFKNLLVEYLDPAISATTIASSVDKHYLLRATNVLPSSPPAFEGPPPEYIL